MKVLMLTSDVSLQCGIARHVLLISEGLRSLPDVEVAVCTVYPHGELSQLLQSVGVKTYSLNAASGHDVGCLSAFRHVLQDYKPDVIHVHMLAFYERLYLSWIRPGIPIVRTVHGINDVDLGLRKRGFRDYVENLLAWLTPIHVDKDIYISEGVRRQTQDDKGCVIYNPVRLCSEHVTNSVRDQLGIAEKAMLIGTACRISDVKAPKAFAEVMCRVLSAMPEVHAIVCGTSENSSLQEKLEGIVARFGCGARFHWLGYRKDAVDVIRQLNCFILTSVSEGMPSALLEAMSVRVPIAFMKGRGGLVDLEMLNSEEGPMAAISEAGDCVGLAEGVIRLLTHADLSNEHVRRATSAIVRHFDVQAVATQLANVYREVCKR